MGKFTYFQKGNKKNPGSDCYKQTHKQNPSKQKTKAVCKIWLCNRERLSKTTSHVKEETMRRSRLLVKNTQELSYSYQTTLDSKQVKRERHIIKNIIHSREGNS